MPKQVVEYFDLSYREGKAILENPNKASLAQKVFERLGHTDKVRRVKAVFTLDSSPDCKSPRGYYRAVVLPALTAAFIDLGNKVDDGDSHEYVKAYRMGTPEHPKYHPPRQIMGMEGKAVYAPCSTAAIPDEAEYWRFLEDLRQWAAEHLYVNIPDPTPARMRGQHVFPE